MSLVVERTWLRYWRCKERPRGIVLHSFPLEHAERIADVARIGPKTRSPPMVEHAGTTVDGQLAIDHPKRRDIRDQHRQTIARRRHRRACGQSIAAVTGSIICAIDGPPEQLPITHANNDGPIRTLDCSNAVRQFHASGERLPGRQCAFDGNRWLGGARRRGWVRDAAMFGHKHLEVATPFPAE